MNRNLSFNTSSNMQGLGLPGLLLGAMALLPSVGQGQSVVYQHAGVNGADSLGIGVSALGDVDGDGAADYIVCSHRFDPSPDGTLRSNAGQATVHSGCTGTAIYSVYGEKSGDNLGFTVGSGGDINGDGTQDFVVCATGHDVDPDGTPSSGDELTNAGRLYAVSGSDGAFLWSYDGEKNRLGLGTGPCIVGDVNADTYADVAVGKWTYDLDDLGPDGTARTGDETGVDGGRVWMLSGKDGSVLWTRDGGGLYLLPAFGSFFAQADKLGRDVDCAGDTNLDGYPDVVAGADGWDADPVGPDGTVFSADDIRSNGRMYLFSGDTGATLAAFAGDNGGMLVGPPFGISESGDRFGESVSGAGDVDLDGYADFMGCASTVTYDPDGTPSSGDEVGGVGVVKVYSGATHSIVYTFDGSEGDNAQQGAQIGREGNIGIAGDVDGDGTLDLLFGSSVLDIDPDGTHGNGDDINNSGRIWVYSGKTGARLFTHEGDIAGGGTAIAGRTSSAGDVNGDGYSEVLATELSFNGVRGRVSVVSSVSHSLTADAHLLSMGGPSTQNLSLDAGVGNALKEYWLFTNAKSSGSTPGVTLAPGVTIPLNPDAITDIIVNITILGGGAPTLNGWKGTLDASGKASASVKTYLPTALPIGVSLNHAALVYTTGGCGVGCDLFHLATNSVPMTTSP